MASGVGSGVGHMQYWNKEKMYYNIYYMLI